MFRVKHLDFLQTSKVVKTGTYVYLVIALLALLQLSCRDETMDELPGVEYDPTSYFLESPASFPLMDIPENNPLTEEGVKLGRMLFYDPLLHPEREHACATCHVQEHAFSSDAAVLPHINLGWNTSFLWKGEVSGTLEDIMLFEVKKFFQTDLDDLKDHPDYPRLFFEAFGKLPITNEQVASALSQFERTMISANSRYDKILSQDVFPTEDEARGYEIFFSEKGDCFHCHGGILFTDNLFHNNALDASPDPGLEEVTGSTKDFGKFKTPTLRNIEMTAPYMHDGRYETLEEVIDFYSYGLKYTKTVDPLMKFVHSGGIELTSLEKQYLIAFLKTLTDSTFITNPGLSNPFN
jgi:cytochrome c peroxidase